MHIRTIKYCHLQKQDLSRVLNSVIKRFESHAFKVILENLQT